MIFATAVAVALTASSRQELIDRWLRADKTHAVEYLHMVPCARANVRVPDLGALAQRELATPGRYRLAPRAAPPEAWWRRALDWISDRSQGFWRALFGRVRVGKEAVASIGDALLAVVSFVLLITIVRLVRNVQITRAASSNTHGEALHDAPSASALYRQASDFANAGDYGSAALLLFAATITLLDSRDAVVATRSSTVRELRRQLHARDAKFLGAFDAVAAPFVQRAYAERAIGEAQWTRARLAYGVILSGVEG